MALHEPPEKLRAEAYVRDMSDYKEKYELSLKDPEASAGMVVVPHLASHFDGEAGLPPIQESRVSVVTPCVASPAPTGLLVQGGR